MCPGGAGCSVHLCDAITCLSLLGWVPVAAGSWAVRGAALHSAHGVRGSRQGRIKTLQNRRADRDRGRAARWPATALVTGGVW